MQSLAPWFVVIVGGQLIYHLVLRGLDPEDNAIATIVVAYATGAAMLVVLGLASGGLARPDGGGVNWARASLVGVGVTMIEMGFLMAYRHGLPVSFGALATLSFSTLLLVPIGMLVFHEGVEVADVVGGGLVIVGLFLLARGG